MDIVLLSGSARKDGDSQLILDYFSKHNRWRLIDLNDYSFSYYDYEHANRGDEFLPLVKDIIQHQKTIVFLTPVYWYAMSGLMKVFLDRMTDLITIEKDWGRKLRGMGLGVITTSNGNNLGEDFWLPFSKTAEYLGMLYLENLHTLNGQGDLEKFRLAIESKTVKI